MTGHRNFEVKRGHVARHFEFYVKTAKCQFRLTTSQIKSNPWLGSWQVTTFCFWNIVSVTQPFYLDVFGDSFFLVCFCRHLSRHLFNIQSSVIVRSAYSCSEWKNGRLVEFQYDLWLMSKLLTFYVFKFSLLLHVW